MSLFEALFTYEKNSVECSGKSVNLTAHIRQHVGIQYVDNDKTSVFYFPRKIVTIYRNNVIAYSLKLISFELEKSKLICIPTASLKIYVWRDKTIE